MTVSTCFTTSLTGTPDASAALKTRAPSMWTGQTEGMRAVADLFDDGGGDRRVRRPCCGCFRWLDDAGGSGMRAVRANGLL